MLKKLWQLMSKHNATPSITNTTVEVVQSTPKILKSQVDYELLDQAQQCQLIFQGKRTQLTTAVVYLGAGCFWGSERYFSALVGVVATEVGYANGHQAGEVSYKEVCTGTTNHAEVVKITYLPELLSLTEILELFFTVIDPTSVNKQGGDIGSQYRTGVYQEASSFVTNEKVVAEFFVQQQAQYANPIVVENLPLVNYYPAETYHQQYLQKNPQGYCHINLSNYQDEIDQVNLSSITKLSDLVSHSV